MEVTPEMVRKLYAAGEELSSRVVLALRGRDLPNEVRRDVCSRAVCFLIRVIQSYASLPVTVRDVFVADVRDTLTGSREELSRALGSTPARAGRRVSAPLTELTSAEVEQFVAAAARAEDALVGCLVGLGVPEADALVEVVEMIVDVVDLPRSIVSS